MAAEEPVVIPPVAIEPAGIGPAGISAHKQRRRRRIEIVWIILTVAYGLGRAIVVGVTLGRYGVNPWIYAAIDAATSVPLGLGSARATTAAIDRDWASARKWAALAAFAFIAPDVSIFVMGGHRLPPLAFVIVGAVVLVTATLAIREARAKVRAGRKARLAAALAPDSHDDSDSTAITTPK